MKKQDFQVSLRPYLKVFICLLAMAGLAGCEQGRASLPALIDALTSGKPTQIVRSGPDNPAGPVTQAAVPPAAPPPAPRPAPAVPPPAQAAAPSAPQVEVQPLEPPALPAPPPLVAPRAAQTVRVGFLAPLSGPNAPLGRMLFDAAQLALFDLADDRFILVPRDTEGQAEAAARAATEILAEGVDIIIGPLFASSAAAVAPLARQRGVKVLSFSTDRSVAGGGVYTLGFAPDQQVVRVVRYAVEKNLTRFALLAPDSPYGQAVTAAMGEALAGSEGRLLHQDRYPADSPDLTPVMRRFTAALRAAAARDTPPPLPPPSGSGAGQDQAGMPAAVPPALPPAPADAILLPEGGAKLRALAPLLPYFDIDPRNVRFIGTGLWDDPGLGTEPALVGGWFAAPAPEGFEDFRKRFEQVYGRRPHRLASLAYDAMALAGILARVAQQQPNPTLFEDALLHNSDGFAGYDGIFRFLPNGVVERGLAVMEVQRRAPRVVDPAPARFAAPVN